MGATTRMLAAGAALLLILGLGPSANAPPQKDAERGVRRALIRLNQLLGSRDMALLDEFVDADDAMLIGTEAGEVARGRSAIETYLQNIFARPESFAFSWREVQVSVRGTTAWLFAEGTRVFRGETGDVKEPYRLTGVLELHNGRWAWRQFHGSQPVA
ncbi:nuclear transport factor 2 family protein [Phenylobacterium deserti]|uniref:SnoaL-like domain-containing protein n=1 Tax=Phenylobacterium deserti TaxID=1914756 RepID=A0A328ANC6_9CAUL|nr:nuclear transport factor 2 family protein [Phenylobacterium deserti]RAK56512.1 hypothetical protein DJ018_00565 [Phenylobacterium deserti]